jgi:hypothetical protein
MQVGPVALLVVPNYHGLGRIDRDEKFCDYLRDRQRRGDEIVLHGYWHRDHEPPARSPLDWVERSAYTDREGEFSRLGACAARARILRGLAVLRAAGWRPAGFVAPAWMMSMGTRDALEGLPLQYCATRDAVVTIRDERRIHAPSLVMSTRSAWRRSVSTWWNRLVIGQHLDAPVLRAALHPTDIRHPEIRALWTTLLRRCSDRSVLTEGRLVEGS